MSAAASERIAAFALLLLLPACSIKMALPPEFLQVERSTGSQFKAVTTDDARVWVREFDDPDQGPLSFWTTTLKSDCIDRRGYQFVGEGACMDGNGNAGTWLEFRGAVGGEPQGYLVAVFVRSSGLLGNGQTIRTVEFAAREATFAARRQSVVDALATVHR